MKYPPANVRVIAETAKFRCLAYVDAHGVWRQHYGNAPLENVIGWNRPETLHEPKSPLERNGIPATATQRPKPVK